MTAAVIAAVDSPDAPTTHPQPFASGVGAEEELDAGGGVALPAGRALDEAYGSATGGYAEGSSGGAQTRVRLLPTVRWTHVPSVPPDRQASPATLPSQTEGS